MTPPNAIARILPGVGWQAVRAMRSVARLTSCGVLVILAALVVIVYFALRAMVLACLCIVVGVIAVARWIAPGKNT